MVSFSRFRESKVFRHLFEGVLSRCMAEGLVRGEGFVTDASIIKADVNRQRRVTPASATAQIESDNADDNRGEKEDA